MALCLLHSQFLATDDGSLELFTILIASCMCLVCSVAWRQHLEKFNFPAVVLLCFGLFQCCRLPHAGTVLSLLFSILSVCLIAKDE